MYDNKNCLTSAEIGCLWTMYMNDSMSKCILAFMLEHLEDEDVVEAVKHAYDISQHHLDVLADIFETANWAKPVGFQAEDVNLHAPWLFSDAFCLTYINHMAKVGMITYSGFVAMSKRNNIRGLFSEALVKTNNLFNETTEIAENKELHATHPFIEIPQETDYIESKDYYSGLNPLKQKRPLNAIEISHLYTNIITNTVGLKLSMAFAQTSQSKEIQDFLLRGKGISNKHIKIFTDILLENDIAAPRLPDLSVSDSTTHTFSDKLIMFHMSLLNSAGTGNYATAAAASQRTDLAVNYERLSLEIGQYAKSGVDIMIKHHWLEQPPGTKDREMLARKKE
ncbi:Protein of unknown function [Alteribacillus persepolensis]|uniref:DUF3231 family protein n=1 Tax=Alteribacillus persepolensis TaxID=568899 RepID=A0A1G7Z2B6_9BACI|nr:DUF3231 family protein [Alteribacillus persepolensis]SDH02739.1 Protein of unknown function [Alteribacillus persepolensis]